jgi:hypothetical protein
MIFPKQKIADSKKDKTWRKNNVDFIVNHSINENYADIERMQQAYRLINSELDQDDYRQLCQNLGVNVDTGRKFVQAYNKVHNIYSAFKGEELRRPFSFSVVNISRSATNDIIRESKIKHRNYVNAVFKATLESMYEQFEVEKKLQAGELKPGQADRQLKKIEQKLSEQYSKIHDEQVANTTYKNSVEAKETMINKLVKMASLRQRIKWTKNETFGDAIVASKEFVEIKFSPTDNMPEIRQLNPLNVFYHKSPDSPFVHDGDYAGYKEEMTIGQVFDEYGADLTDEDTKKIENYVYDGIGTYGTNDRLFHSRGDRHASSWLSKREAGLYPAGDSMDPHARILREGKIEGIPDGSNSAYNRVNGPGLYADNRNRVRDYCVVYTVYWKSYRKMIEYTYTNPKGELAIEIVDDSFVIPKHARKESVRKNKYFGKSETIHVWYDDEENYNSAREIWIPEIWKGTKINNDIYVNVEPLENAYQSLLNPYATKLPIHGYVYGSRNATVISVINRLEPWQKLYYVIMSKVLRMIVQDKGILTFLNSLVIDKDIGFQRTLQMLEDQGLTTYNPMAHNKGGQLAVDKFKVVEQVNASTSDSIDHYIQLLQFIETQIMEIVGMSPQRLAKSEKYSTATDNQKQTAHSMNITENMFYDHQILWEDIMQSYMEMLISSLNDDSGYIRGFLDDEEIAIIDIGKVSLEDEYLLKIKNNSRNHEILEQAYQLSLTLLQNDKAKFSTIIDLMQTDDLDEFKHELKKVEKEMEDREEMMEKRRQEHLEKVEKMKVEAREDEQIHDLDKTYLEKYMDEQREHVKGRYMVTSYNMQNDMDESGEADLLEKQIKYQDLLAKVAQNDQNINLRQAELLQDQQQHEDRLSQRDEEIRKQQEQKEKERRTKERIASQKANTTSS